jgi:hypothetical protein
MITPLNYLFRINAAMYVRELKMKKQKLKAITKLITPILIKFSEPNTWNAISTHKRNIKVNADTLAHNAVTFCRLT